MGKRAPKGQKAQGKKETKKQGIKAEDEEPAHFEVFTPQFYETLQSFKNFYKEVLTLKSKEQGTDLSAQFKEVRTRVSAKLEQESTKILKDQLSGLEQWIQNQQQKLATDAEKIESAYKSNSSSLASTNSFSDQEIRKQLLPIQAKIDEKHNTHASYGELLKRSKEIYE